MGEPDFLTEFHAEGVTYLDTVDGRARFQVGSGTYHFVAGK